MSALPPKADMELSRVMSALCQKRTFSAGPFDHPVSGMMRFCSEVLPMPGLKELVGSSNS